MIIQTAAFLGGAEFKNGDSEYQAAWEVAKILSVKGLAVLNGGGPGIMRASTEGAQSVGGKVIGVTYYPKYEHANYEGRDPQNLFGQEIVALDYFDRTKKLLEMGNVHILFRGGTGTIGEFGMTWASSRIHQGHNIPIILFGAFWGHVINAFKKYMYVRSGETRLYHIVETAAEVWPIIEKYRRN